MGEGDERDDPGPRTTTAEIVPMHLPPVADEPEPLRDPRTGDVDEWGRSERVRSWVRTAYDPMYRHWFRAEWEGLDKIPTEGGALPVHTIAQGFSTVPARAARPWVIQNAPERLILRIVFRFGETFRDGELRGAVLNLVAAQVFNDGTGNVLLDTTRTPGPPGRWSSAGRATILSARD